MQAPSLGTMLGAAVFGLASPALAGGGEEVFQRCYACHSVEPGVRSLPGPNLAGVVGRRAGAEEGFDYSPALRAAADRGLIWSQAELDRFLADPEAVVPNTWMSFEGLHAPSDRRAVIDYLKAHTRR